MSYFLKVMLVLPILAWSVPLLLLVLYAQFRWRNRHILAAASKLPCPRALPILGNALLFLGGITSMCYKTPATACAYYSDSRVVPATWSADFCYQYSYTCISSIEKVMLVLPILAWSVPLLLLVLYAQFRWRNRHILAAASKLPCPSALPILGNALLFLGGITSVTKSIVTFTTKFKGLFCFWVGPVPLFVVSDPNDVQIVLNNSNTLAKDDIYSFLKPYIGNGLLTGPVPIWKKYRRLISPILHPANVRKYMPVFNDVSKQLIGRITEANLKLDPREATFSASMDAIMRTILARNPVPNNIKMDVQFLLKSVGGMFTLRLFKVWLHLDWVFNFLYRNENKIAHDKIENCIEYFNKEWKDEESNRLADSEVNQSYTPDREGGKHLLDIGFSTPPIENEDHEWKDEIFTMIVGATDTVVAAATFLLLTLAHHPNIQEKIYAEIQEVLGEHDRDMTDLELNSMKYLGYCLMESMRIHGAFPVILRKATKDTKLMNTTLPAGSRIMIPLHAMGLDADIFPEPHKFIPERFSPDNIGENKRHVYSFLPFSGGPRNCIGKAYAMLIMKAMVVRVLRKFKVTSEVKLEDIRYELNIVMCSENALNMQFHPRRKNEFG